MTRAEEAANKAHPVDDNSVFNYALNLGFVEGYQQAEKDLALTWQDIKQIVNLADETIKVNTGFESEQAYYEEVLRLFNNSEK